MEKSRTYWNTNSLLKPGDRYIQLELNNAGPKPIITRRSGELLEGYLITSTEECIECENLELAMKQAKRLCEEAVQQGYYAYCLPAHGKSLLKRPKMECPSP